MAQASGELQVELTYRPFEDDDADSGYREAEAYALALQQHAITDVKVIQSCHHVMWFSNAQPARRALHRLHETALLHVPDFYSKNHSALVTRCMPPQDKHQGRFLADSQPSWQSISWQWTVTERVRAQTLLKQHMMAYVLLQSAADASSRAAVAASAAAAAVAVTKAAAARAATKAAVATRTAARSKRQAAASGKGKAGARSAIDRGATESSNSASSTANGATGAEELQSASHIQAQLLSGQLAPCANPEISV